MPIPDPAAWIQTATGGRFYPLDPRPEDVRIEDIAHGLANICRFGGQCTPFYSVAQHSLLVASLVPPEDQRWALLHDASEAYIGDVIRPFKRCPEFERYREIERATMDAICHHFGLQPEEPASIRAADMLALATEARDLMPRAELEAWEYMPSPLPFRVQPLPSEEARKRFLATFRALARPI